MIIAERNCFLRTTHPTRRAVSTAVFTAPKGLGFSLDCCEGFTGNPITIRICAIFADASLVHVTGRCSMPKNDISIEEELQQLRHELDTVHRLLSALQNAQPLRKVAMQQASELSDKINKLRRKIAALEQISANLEVIP